MVHLLTKGGMGNQMFQYAFALQVQKKCGGKIYINGLWHPFSRDKRKMSLSHFRLSENSCVCTKNQQMLILFRLILLIFFLMLRGGWKCLCVNELSCNSAFLCSGVYITRDVYFLPLIYKKSTSHIFGYFQKPRVVWGIENELKNAFIVTTPPSKENAAFLSDISRDNSVCVHIRRGDYSLYSQLQVCSYTYYSRAIKLAKREILNPVFYIFSTSSDDIEWIKKHYNFGEKVIYVDLNNPDYEELRLMMSCKHFIISNSTFSWWAAFLSQAAGKEKRVYCPSVWLKGSVVDMLYDGWMAVPVD